MELPKTYNPKEVEDKIYQKWESSGFFNPDKLEEASDRYWKAEVFSMAMPPPNATGELHMGHAMMLTIEDLMTRFARMSGQKTLWLPGTDHAAIATQNVVERQIWEREKKTRHDLGREELLQRINEFVSKTRGRIQMQIRKIGSSCDFSREKYTLSAELTLAVRTVFKQMSDQGLIYRRDRLVNWCPRCSTTLADDEVEYQAIAGRLYYLRYPFTKSKGYLTIATTRPETMLADTAVAVHPKDTRYKKIVGQTVILPLLNRELLVIADEQVDRDFGTGVLKVTPGHDPLDFEIGQKHNLEIINLFTPYGKISAKEAADHGFEDYANLTVEEARIKIIQELQTQKFLEKTEELTHNVGFCYRCNTAIEPIISKQWFVNANEKFKVKSEKFKTLLKLTGEASLKEIAAAAIKSAAIKIVPKRFEKVYLTWIDNLRDWNISRQIWFGHRLPVWYCSQSNAKPLFLKKMGFAAEVAQQIFNGKTKTYRLRDHGFKIGDCVAFENSQTNAIFGYGIITNVQKTTVGELPLDDKAHGAIYNKLTELILALKKHYPDLEVTQKTEAYIYTYKFSAEQPPSGTCGEIIVSIEEPTKCPSCGSPNLTQDPDTLDTWFSSSLWTFSTLGWPETTSDLKTYHPTTILETGYDILFFWVARMIIMTGFALSDIPFRTVYLHGLVRDREGKKMSKSKGNVTDPIEMVNRYGADALRLSLITGTTAGNDTKIYEEKIQSSRNFVNKLWNIARFILRQTPNPTLQTEMPKAITLADQWILGELQNLIFEVQKNFNNYQYGLVGEILTEFSWNKFADWYLEISKIEKSKEQILLYVLQTFLKLWHPFIPFVTEHLWSQFSDELLMVQEYPTLKNSKIPARLASQREAGRQIPKSKTSEKFKALQELIAGLRNLRSEYHQPPAEIFASYLELPKKLSWIKDQIPVIEKLARIKLNLEKIPADKKMPYFIWQDTRVFLIIPHFDPQKERALAEKELKETDTLIKKLGAQLSKKEFLKKAPAEIVEKIKLDFTALQDRKEKLQAKIKSLK